MIDLTIEQTFLATYILAFLVGVGFGFLTYWFFEKENRND